jgi:formylglycine-generating enzyme required for sulfatase activity
MFHNHVLQNRYLVLILFCLSVLVSCRSQEEEGIISKAPEMVQLPSGLWVSKYEITQAQWMKVMGDNPSYFQGKNLPVESVSYRQVNAFCKKLTEIEGRTEVTAYRLPTLTEWEYACRGGTTTAFYTGIMIVAPSEEKYLDSAANQAGWYKLNADGHEHRVGLKMPNKYGLYDMHGNVGEYVLMDSTHKLISKGGSWYDYADGCQVHSQNVMEQRNKTENFSQFIGFRVVQSAR